MNDKIIFSVASDRVHYWVSFLTAMNIYVVVPGLCQRALWKLVGIPVGPATSDFKVVSPYVTVTTYINTGPYKPKDHTPRIGTLLLCFTYTTNRSVKEGKYIY